MNKEIKVIKSDYITTFIWFWHQARHKIFEQTNKKNIGYVITQRWPELQQEQMPTTFNKVIQGKHLTNHPKLWHCLNLFEKLHNRQKNISLPSIFSVKTLKYFDAFSKFCHERLHEVVHSCQAKKGAERFGRFDHCSRGSPFLSRSLQFLTHLTLSYVLNEVLIDRCRQHWAEKFNRIVKVSYFKLSRTQDLKSKRNIALKSNQGVKVILLRLIEPVFLPCLDQSANWIHPPNTCLEIPALRLPTGIVPFQSSPDSFWRWLKPWPTCSCNAKEFLDLDHSDSKHHKILYNK